ncbi:MAG: hypothetical protein ACREBV_08885, partial [Candidatus Zixiibacteriota bacterium]
ITILKKGTIPWRLKNRWISLKPITNPFVTAYSLQIFRLFDCWRLQFRESQCRLTLFNKLGIVLASLKIRLLSKT